MISDQEKSARLSRRPVLFTSVAAAVCILAFAQPARAALQLCNRTSYVLDVATAIQQRAKILTRGWTRVTPGDCATAIAEPLSAPAYFVYARSSSAEAQPPRAWGGQFRFCATDGTFAVETPVSLSGCKSANAYQAPFASVPTGGAPSWTMTFTESAGLATPDDARAAGFKRLLALAGYAADGGSKGLNEALAKFRARMKLPASTGSSEIFTALDAEARKRDAPSGYSICNDGNFEIWAALSFKDGKDFVSRGWWNIAAGRCARAITDALGRGAVYLFVSKHGNNHLVSGPEQFCISNAAFDIRGRDRCAARGYASAGFLATNFAGLPGFAAHIGNSGVAASQLPTPK